MARKALVADDEEKYRFIARTALESLGYEVKEAADGEFAVWFAKKYKPDLILLDETMPDMDGYEACRAIRDFSKAIIIGMATEYSPSEWRKAGADVFLRKPVLLENPQDTIRKSISAAGR